MDEPIIRYKIITNELIVHSQLRSLSQLLKREITYSLILNKSKVGSVIEFEATEAEEKILKEQLGFTILKKNDAGWIPVI
jgi:hypothetical protein